MSNHFTGLSLDRHWETSDSTSATSTPFNRLRTRHGA